MAKTTLMSARVSPIVKKEIEGIFKELGMSTSDAINMFFNQVRLRNGLPFEVTIPKEEKEKRKKKLKEETEISKATQ